MRTKAIIIIFFTLALLFLIYLPSLPADFFISDDTDLVLAPQLRGEINFQVLKTIFTPATHVDFYPIRDMTHLLENRIFGLNPVVFRATNLILVFAIVVSTFTFLSLLGVNFLTASLAASAWALNSVHSEAVLWIAGRKDLLSQLFALLACISFLKAKGSKVFGMAFLLLFFGSLLSKASFALLPLAVLALHFLGFLKLERNRLLLTAMACLLSVCVLSLHNWFYYFVNDMHRSLDPLLRLRGSVTALGKMVAAWFTTTANVWEIDNGPDWIALNSPYLIVGTLTWAISVLGVLYNRRLMPILVFGLALYIPVSGLFFPHRMLFSVRYLEPAVLSVLLGVVLVSNKATRVNIVLMLLAVMEIPGLMKMVEIWGSNPQVIRHATHQSPSDVFLKSLLAVHSQDLSERIRLSHELEEICLEPKESCRNFYLSQLYRARSLGERGRSLAYLNLYQTSVKGLDPLPKAYWREHLLTELKFDRPTAPTLERWLEENQRPFTVVQRLLKLTALCQIKQLESAREAFHSYRSGHLLRDQDVEDFIYNLNSENRSQFLACRIAN